jgi:hypothetical protein
MVLALAVNIVLATIVFAAVIALIMRAIRGSDASPAVSAAEPRPAHQARTRRHAGAFVPARPWA